MKAKFEKVTFPVDSAFNIIEFSTTNLRSLWHFHTAYEIVYIGKGSGKLFAGNYVDDFKKGDLVFLGSNLPHAWLKKDSPNNNSKLTAGILVQFNSDFIPESWLKTTEFKFIKNALDKSQSGVRITGTSKKLVLSGLNKIIKANGIEKITLLLQILDIIGSEKSIQTISGIDYYSSFKGGTKEKMESIFNYILNNYLNEISINKVAEIAGMNEAAFCRYFKKNTTKTFMQVVNQMRVGYACNLLKDNKLTVSEICFESGYKNISNFNKNFKALTKKSPTQYRNDFLKTEPGK